VIAGWTLTSLACRLADEPPSDPSTRHADASFTARRRRRGHLHLHQHGPRRTSPSSSRPTDHRAGDRGDVVFTTKVTNNSAEAGDDHLPVDDRSASWQVGADMQRRHHPRATGEAGDSCTFTATFAVPAATTPSSHKNTFRPSPMATVTPRPRPRRHVSFNRRQADDQRHQDRVADLRLETGEDVNFTFTVKNTSTRSRSRSRAHGQRLRHPGGRTPTATPDRSSRGPGTVLRGASAVLVHQAGRGDFSARPRQHVHRVAVDDDGTRRPRPTTPRSASTDVKPTISVTKTASPTSVLETART